MGRRSPHHSSKREDSASPRRRKNSHSSRKHKDEDDKRRKSSNLKGMEEAKRRMREGLESASKSTAADVPSCAPRPFDDLSTMEQVSRARDIERIEEEGFQQAQFKSGGGKVQKKQQSKADKVETAQEHHDRAMFGPAWMDKQLKKNDEIPLPSTVTASFLIDQDKRKAAWLRVWREQRRTLGINC